MAEAITQSVYERFLDKVVRGAYPPGQRLVNRTVAEELGVSVIPVREALGRLISEGLVEHIPGAGSFVRALDNRELAKLYALREHLEVFAVVEAAQSAQAYQITRLQQCCEHSAVCLKQFEASAESRGHRQAAEAWIDSDTTFHSTIIEAADNPWLALAVERLRILAHVARAKPRDLEIAVLRNALKEHMKIAKAIENHDPAKAEALMRQHIQRAMNAVLTGTLERGKRESSAVGSRSPRKDKGKRT